jgi:hypothetical protein
MVDRLNQVHAQAAFRTNEDCGFHGTHRGKDVPRGGETLRNLMILTICVYAMTLSSGCGTCEPNPERGQCASQTCGQVGNGNFEDNFACQTEDGRYYGWRCREEPSFAAMNPMRCESFGDEEE